MYYDKKPLSFLLCIVDFVSIKNKKMDFLTSNIYSLPSEPNLPTEKLSAVFSNVTNSYKFFWFWAILDSLKENQNTQISFENLSIKMIANAWIMIDFYKLSLGKQDQFLVHINTLQSKFSTLQNIKPKNITTELEKIKDTKEFQNIIKELLKYVPYRFIRPFFVEETKALKDNDVNNQIVFCANKNFNNANNPSIYQFSDNKNEIILNPLWLFYLQKNLSILLSFLKYHIVVYLQKNNPNTPNIIDKLEIQKERDLNNAKVFWKNYITKNPNCTCIFSNQSISIKEMSIDHFLPFSFLAHDLLWNLAPTTSSINSSKNNAIPDIKMYLDKFCTIQFDAFKSNFGIIAPNKLEDYTILFKMELSDIDKLKFEIFAEKLQQTIIPLSQIAINMGFVNHWIYK